MIPASGRTPIYWQKHPRGKSQFNPFEGGDSPPSKEITLINEEEHE